MRFRTALALPCAAALLTGCRHEATGPAPHIGLAPASVTLDARLAGADPAPQQVDVTNVTGGTLDGLSVTVAYPGGVPTGWLAASLSATSAPAILTLQAAVGALAPGDYQATVAIAAPSADNSPQSVSVAFAVTAADLTVTAPAFSVSPDTFYAGDTVRLSAWTIENAGTASAGGFSAGYHFSADSEITPADAPLTTALSIAGLAPGAAVAESARALVIPPSLPGTYYVGVLVDEGATNAESDETNNYLSVPVTVLTPYPDLVISAPAVYTPTPDTVVAGQAVQLPAWTITNQGRLYAGTEFDGFYLSTDSTITAADDRLTGVTTLTIQPGDSFTWGAPTLTIPDTLVPGDYYIGVLVDETDTVVESDEGNNFISGRLTVVAPLLRYPFDGDAANAAALPGYDGDLTNAEFLPGKVGQAIKFDGSGTTGVVFPGSGDLFARGARWTISFWFREDTLKASSWLWSFRSRPGGTTGWETYHGIDPSILTTCSGASQCFSFPSPAAGVWHHLLYRYDAPSAQQGAPVDIYVDGVLAGQVPNPAQVPLAGAAGADIRFGNFQASSAAGGIAYVDELRVYPFVFTDADQCTVVIGGTWDGASCSLP
jgi:Concanavalin A-like lectin/glucanases superfamily/CARDB